MKARIATVLSLSGVLVAGSAAALVNNQVLQSAQPGSASGSNVTLVLGTPVPARTEPAPTSSSAAPSSSVPLSQPVMYQVGDAGVVTLDTAGDVLAVVAATPSAGWTVLVAESIDAYNVSVQLLAGATLVEFRANLSMGVVVTSVESREVDLTSTSFRSQCQPGAPLQVAPRPRPPAPRQPRSLPTRAPPRRRLPPPTTTTTAVATTAPTTALTTTATTAATTSTPVMVAATTTER